MGANMENIYRIVTISLLLHLFVSCTGQSNNNNRTSASAGSQGLVGGRCDGCELMFVDMPAQITSVDTSSGWWGEGQKLVVSGTVYKRDGKTPAPDVILYYWQTGNDGYYTPKEGMDERAKRHGHIRGWVKTDTAGQYAIYTIRPKPYPNTTSPAHIHLSVKEPDIRNEYYIDEWVFEDDPFVTTAVKNAYDKRGGSGVLKISQKGGLQVARQHIILGLNIPNYPQTNAN